jgi:outer membrane biosynthesis protein TonB
MAEGKLVRKGSMVVDVSLMTGSDGSATNQAVVISSAAEVL